MGSQMGCLPRPCAAPQRVYKPDML